MKRNDEYIGIESRRTGVFTSVKSYGLEEIKSVDNEAFLEWRDKIVATYLAEKD